MNGSIRVCAATLLSILAPFDAGSQVRVESAVLFESYSFDEGFALGGTPEVSSVSQLSVPFALTFPIGRRASLTASGGLTRVALTVGDGSGDVEPVTGLTDTEVRLGVDLVPDRLRFIATGAVPTGQASLEAQQTAILTVLVRDALGFSTRSLGTGGHVGGGFAGAVPAGEMALGFAGTYTQFGSYEPVTGTSRELKPAGEVRLRGGLEGPVGTGGYIRTAVIFARRGEDQINGETAVESSSRVAAYFSFDRRFGNASFLGYVYDLYRAGAQLEGAALLPKANVMAAGVEFTLPVARATRVLPRIELRRTDQATGDADELHKLGTSVRFGADLRHRLAGGAVLVIEANGLVGDVVGDVEMDAGSVGVSGFRLGAHLQITP